MTPSPAPAASHLFHFIIAILVFLSSQGLSAQDTGAGQSEGPRDLVMRVSNRLVDELRAQREAIQKNREIAYELAEEILVPHVAFERIGRWVLGKHWRTASESQRQAFLRSFKQHLMKTYASSMVTYTDEILKQADDVTYLPLRESTDQDQVSVRSRIPLPRGGDAQVDYTMVKTQDGWKIADLSIDGISLALTYRKEFSAQIARDGLDSLIARLEDKNTAPLEL